jgi:hypothetical protein
MRANGRQPQQGAGGSDGWRVLIEEPQRDVLAPVYAAILRTVYLLPGGIAPSVLTILSPRAHGDAGEGLQRGRSASARVT